MSIKIRKAERNDLDSLIILYLELLKYVNQFAKHFSRKNSFFDKEEIKKAIKNRVVPSEKNIFLVAEENKNLLGFVQAEIMSSRESKTDKRVVEVVDIYTKTHKRGTGKKLLEEIERWARKRKAKFILWEFLYGNNLAENFCVRNKFKHFKTKMLKELK